MSEFMIFLAEVFREVLYMSLTALIIGAAVLLAGKLLQKKITPRWQRLMWLLVFLALLVPFRPESSISLSGFAEPLRSLTLREDYDRSQQQYQVLPDNMQEAFQATQSGREHDQLRIRHILVDIAVPLVWLVGVLVIAVYYLAGGVLLRRRILTGKAETDETGINKLLDECKEQTGVSKEFEIVFQDHIKSPAVFGVLKPKIILPLYVDEMDDTGVRYILLHELGHYKRYDMLISLVMMIVQALYWFNPAIRILLKHVRQDIELANDAYVLGLIGEEQKANYSNTLVEALGRSGGIPVCTRLVCMADSKSDIKRRIESLKLSGVHNKNRIAAAILSSVIITVLSLFFLTGSGEAAEPGSPYDDIAGTWIRDYIRGEEGEKNIIEIFTFDPDGTLSVTSSNNGVRHRVLNGFYEADEENGTLRLEYTHIGTTDNSNIGVITVTPSYTLSADRSYLTMSDDGHTAGYVRTVLPSIPLLSGVWTGNRKDGTPVVIEFDINGILSIQTKHDGLLSEREIMGYSLGDSKISFGSVSYVYSESPELRVWYSTGILISTDGYKLLLHDLASGESAGFLHEGEILELFRQR